MSYLKTTARKVIRNSLIRANIIGYNDDINADEAFAALDLLNETLDQWNNEVAMFSYQKEISFPSFSNVYTYNINDTQRAVDGIKEVFYVKNGSSSPIRELTKAEFELKGTSNFYNGEAMYYYYEGTFPIAKLHIYPANEGEIKIITSGNFEFFNDLDSEIYLPSGYVRALTNNLSVQLCAFYGKDAPQVLADKAAYDKNMIKDSSKKNVKKQIRLNLW